MATKKENIASLQKKAEKVTAPFSEKGLKRKKGVSVIFAAGIALALVLGIISTSGERSRVYEEYLSNSNDIDFEYLRYEDTYDRWNANDIGNDVKRDPIWLAYNRAYKAHYTRYMKKKMTVSEFEEWSRQAVVWRIEAEQGKLKLTEYEILLKK